ncbi:MAG: glycosyltransferase family 39 protein [Chthoniobacteraceae bacterium]|nr:glycosyltransferase family 39 protein [Chthoniobacteraceae bacterium]
MHRHPVISSALSYLALGAVFFSFAYFLTQDIDRPWVNQIDFNGAVWSQAAHNILRAGLLETQGASTAFYFGPLPIPNAGYYLHHPPLLHLGIAVLFSLLGEHEWVARMVPIVCTLCSALLLWLLVRDTLGRRTALFCTAVFASLPMSLRYGTMVNFEPVVLCLILAALYALRHWEQTGRPVWKTLFFASLLVGMWVDWAMHLFALALFAWWMTRPGRPARRLAWTVLAMTGICGLLYLVHTQFLRPDALQDLQRTFLVRVASDAKYKFTFWQWAAKVSASLVHHFLWTGLGAAAIGGIIAYRRRKEPGVAWIGWASFMVFAMDAVFVGVFQNDSYIHEYIPFYFIVPVSVLAGIALNQLAQTVENAPAHWARPVGNAAAILLAAAGIWLGQVRTETLQGRFCILDLQKKESEALIPALGKIIRSHFSPETRVLCNFMPYYGPQLEYYARREVAPNLSEPEDWKPYIQKTDGDVGGIVWMGDDDAPAILANLPPGKKEFVRLENESFCLWQPADGDGRPF